MEKLLFADFSISQNLHFVSFNSESCTYLFDIERYCDISQVYYTYMKIDDGLKEGGSLSKSVG